MKETRIDIFGDGMRIFLDYIARQFKKNPKYDPHPLIKAFELAVSGFKDVKNGERAMGLSGDHIGETLFNTYLVIVEKKDNRIKVLRIHNLQVDKELPQDVMIMIFRLQIILDRIPGDDVSPKQVADVLNEVIPEKPYYAIGERWREARDNFKKMLEEGKIHLPKDPKLIEEISKITYDTPWEEYSNLARSVIGTSLFSTLNKKEGRRICITTPAKYKIEKFKVFDMLTEYMLGKTGDYLKKSKKD